MAARFGVAAPSVTDDFIIYPKTAEIWQLATALRGDLSISHLLAYIPLVTAKEDFKQIWGDMMHFVDGFEEGSKQ